MESDQSAPVWLVFLLEEKDEYNKQIPDKWICTFNTWLKEQWKSLQKTVQWSRHENRNNCHDCLQGDLASEFGFTSVLEDDSHFAQFTNIDD